MVARRATCHPEKKHYAKGQCHSCYYKPRMAAWRAKNPGKSAAAWRKWDADHREQRRRAQYSRKLKSQYGITIDDYDRMLEKQGGRCWICQKRPKTKRLAVDHDHEIQRRTGLIVIRGLVCSRCNSRGIGSFEWSDEVLGRAIKYMQLILKLRRQHLVNSVESTDNIEEDHIEL